MGAIIPGSVVDLVVGVATALVVDLVAALVVEQGALPEAVVDRAAVVDNLRVGAVDKAVGTAVDMVVEEVVVYPFQLSQQRIL